MTPRELARHLWQSEDDRTHFLCALTRFAEAQMHAMAIDREFERSFVINRDSITTRTLRNTAIDRSRTAELEGHKVALILHKALDNR